MPRKPANPLREDRRRAILLSVAWVGWLAAFAVIVVTSLLVPPGGNLSRTLILVFVALIGASISAGLALSRQRLTDTIVQVFQTGMSTSSSIRGRKEDSLRVLHQRSSDDGHCAECGDVYPCRTLRVLNGDL